MLTPFPRLKRFQAVANQSAIESKSLELATDHTLIDGIVFSYQNADAT